MVILTGFFKLFEKDYSTVMFFYQSKDPQLVRILDRDEVPSLKIPSVFFFK
jgi:hypothetical protein